MAKEGYVGVDSDKVLAEVCENRHCQNGVGSEVEEMEAIGVHDVAEELRKGRAETAIEEHNEERVPSRIFLPGDGGKHPRARMRSRHRRPEEAELVPQDHRVELRGKGRPFLRSASSRSASADFTAFPLPLSGAMAGVGRRVDGDGDAGDDVAERCFLWIEGSGRDF